MNTTRNNPYIGPRTFQRDESHLFFGREREARDLLGLMITEQLVLFYAQSGAGKSSLVNARLIPGLEKRGYEVFPIGRVGGDLEWGIETGNIYTYNLIRGLIQREANLATLAKLTLSDFLAGLDIDENGYFFNENIPPGMSGETKEPVPRRHVLIIDQFEELFSTHPEAWEEREGFLGQLSEIIQNDPAISVILVMREDYIATLDPFAYLMPGGLRVRYYMPRLVREAALMAIKKPVEQLRPYAEGVAEKLVEDLCSLRVIRLDGTPSIQPGQYVEPVQLQILCYSLWRDLSPDGTQITEKDLQYVGDVVQTLERYYAGRVAEVATTKNVKEHIIREWIEKKLISPGGIRNIVLQEPNRKSEGLADDVIQALQNDLIRAEMRGGAVFYELTHDRLVEPILANNKQWFDENLSPLQRQTTLWNDQEWNESWLLADQALAEVEEWAKQHPDELTDLEIDFLEACRKQQAQIEERRTTERQQLEMVNKLAVEQARSVQRARQMNVITIIQIIVLISMVSIIRARGVQDIIVTVLLIIVSLILGYYLGQKSGKVR